MIDTFSGLLMPLTFQIDLHVPFTNREEMDYESKFLKIDSNQKKKKNQIFKIEKTNILIEIPKTQNKSESNLNLSNRKTQSKVKFHTQINIFSDLCNLQK